MQSEPTAILGAVKLVAMIAAFFGIAVTDNEQQGLAIAIGAVATGIGIVLTIWNRQRVYSQATVDKLTSAAGGPDDVVVTEGVG